MKKKYILVMLIFAVISEIYANQPFQNILSNALGATRGMVWDNGQYLYAGDLYNNSIVKINIQTIPSTPTVTTLITLPSPYTPHYLALKGNELYISARASGTFQDKIFKIDITTNSPVLIDVVTIPSVYSGSNYVGGIAFKGNDLYIANGTDGAILKTDVTTVPATLTTVIPGNQNLEYPEGIAFYGNDLYIAKSGTLKVSKVDITDPTLTVSDVFIGNPSAGNGLFQPYGITIHTNQLYILDDYGGVFKSDISASSPALVRESPLRFSAIVFVNNHIIGSYPTIPTASDLYYSHRPLPPPPSPPTNPISNVLSIFGDSVGYTALYNEDYDFGTAPYEANLSQGSGTNNAWRFDFSLPSSYGQGVDASNLTDISLATSIEFDYWADTNSTNLQFFVVEQETSASRGSSQGNSSSNTINEYMYEIGTNAGADQVMSQGAWTSVSIPISFFTSQGFSLDKFKEWKFDVANNTVSDYIYVDNLRVVGPGLGNAFLSVDSFEETTFKVYPNPASNYIQIKSKNVITKAAIYDISGRIIQNNLNPANNRINIKNLNKGIYMLKVEDDNFNILTQKIMKK